MSKALLKFIKSVAVQPAWYWKDSAGTPDGFGGVTYPAPELVHVRWDGTTQLIVNKDGVEVLSGGELIVTRDMEVDGMIMLASNTTTPPTTPKGADTILKVLKVPMFRSTDMFAYTVYV